MLVVCFVSLLSASEDEGDYIEVPSCDDSVSILLVGAVFAVGFTLGVDSVTCSKPFSGGFVGWASGRFGTGIAGYAVGWNIRDPLGIGLTLGSDGGGSTQFDLGVPEGSSLDLLSSNALWVLTPGRSIALLDFSAGALRTANMWDGTGLPRSVAKDSAATTDPSVRGAISPDELEEAVQLAAARSVDSDAGTRVSVPQRGLNSKTAVQGGTRQEATGRREVDGCGLRKNCCGGQVSPPCGH